MPLASQKHLFDIPEGITYLNCAAQSPCLSESAAAGRRGIDRKFHPWDPERANVGPEMEACRSLFGALVGATGEDVAITFSTSYAVAAAARNLSVEKGEEIVVLEGQFPSNYYAWCKLAERDGGRVRTVARPATFDWTSAVLEAIGPQTGLVTLPNCHWTDGSLVDLERIGPVCRERGIPLVVDATQSIGAMATDVAAIRPDYMIASAYKWLLCPDMMGFMYVAPHRQDGVPVEDNHQGRGNAPSMEYTPGYSDEYAPGARRFDMGAADSMIHLPMSKMALERIGAWGPGEIQASLRILTDRIAERAEAIGLGVPPANQRVGHFIGLWPKKSLPDGLLDKLRAAGIHVSLRGGAIRVSPYLFNDLADIDRLFDVLEPALNG
jgi:selenocysteine lyase/cysteine desulfurase